MYRLHMGAIVVGVGVEIDIDKSFVNRADKTKRKQHRRCAISTKHNFKQL